MQKVLTGIMVLFMGVFFSACSDNSQQTIGMSDSNQELKTSLVSRHKLSAKKLAMNAEYIIADGDVQLVDGEMEISTIERAYTLLTNTIARGNLGGGEKRNDTASILTVHTTGSGVAYYVVACIDGKGTNGAFLGDSVDITNVTIKNGIIRVDYMDISESDNMAAERTVPRTRMFTVEGGILLE